MESGVRVRSERPDDSEAVAALDRAAFETDLETRPWIARYHKQEGGHPEG